MNEKILVIDHEPHIRKGLELILTKRGYQVRTVSGSDEAISVFESQPFDLVIMEVRTLKLNGLKLIRQVKELDEDVEVIVLTGSATIHSAIQALRHHGAFDFLTKPLENIDQLFDSINQALHKQRLNRENKARLKRLEQTKEELEHLVSETNGHK